MIFEIPGSHRGVAEDSTLAGCDAMSTGKQLPTLRRIVFPKFLPSSSPRIVGIVGLDPAHVRTTILRNVGDCLPIYAV
jgi:hypothetical protein